jgi:hypothetical protein
MSKGVTIELLHGGHLISARVVWRHGSQIGLCTDEKLPVDHILTIGQAASLHLAPPCRRPLGRRRRPRGLEDSRLQSRAMQFVSFAVIATCLAATLFTLVEQALAKPVAYAEAALSG